jgi:large subunit ribosomal protein L25
MALVELNVYPRTDTGKNANRRTRARGRIPAVLYGSGRETTNVEVDTHQFSQALLATKGSSVIFSLKQESAADEAIALLRDVQQHPVNDNILHIDLFEIPRGKPITAPVFLRVVGESVDVRRGDAVMSQTLDNVDVSCLPRELPDAVEVDISELGLGDRVYVKDLQIGAGEIITDAESLVLQFRAPANFLEEEEEVAEEVEGEEGAEAKAGEEGEEAKSESSASDEGSKGKGGDS